MSRQNVRRGESLGHIDGCHFYCWVVRCDDGQVRVTFDERQGTDLALHRRDPAEGEERCERCEALSRGASPDHSTLGPITDYPDDPKGAFMVVLAAIADHDESPRA